MQIIDKSAQKFAANTIFSSFFCTCFGFALVQVGAARMHGTMGIHAFLGVPGITLLGLILFRARLHWSANNENGSSIRVRDLQICLALLIAGICIGFMASTSSVLIILIIANLMYVFPWVKISLCRNNFYISATTISGGAVIGIFSYYTQIEPLSFMMAGWILYGLSMCMHVFVLMSLDRGYRVGKKFSKNQNVKVEH